MALGSPTGRPCDVLREHLQYNASSFGGNDSDQFRWMANILAVPFNVNHTTDNTAYPRTATPAQDSWIHRVRLQKTVNGAAT